MINELLLDEGGEAVVGEEEVVEVVVGAGGGTVVVVVVGGEEVVVAVGSKSTPKSFTTTEAEVIFAFRGVLALPSPEETNLVAKNAFSIVLYATNDF